MFCCTVACGPALAQPVADCGAFAVPDAAQALQRGQCQLSAARRAIESSRPADAEPLFLDAAAAFRVAEGPESARASRADLERVRALYELGRMGEAEALARRVLEDRRGRLGEDSGEALDAQNVVAIVVRHAGRTREAMEIYRDLLARERRSPDRRPARELRVQSNLAIALVALGEIVEARRIFEAIRQERERTLGRWHPSTVTALDDELAAQWNSGERLEATRRLEAALPEAFEHLGRDKPEPYRLLTLLAIFREAEARFAEAGELHRQALEARKRILGPGNRATVESAWNVGVSYLANGQPALAVDLAEGMLRERDFPGDWRRRHLLRLLALSLYADARAVEALAVMDARLDASSLRASGMDASSLEALSIQGLRGRVLFAAGGKEEGLRALEGTLAAQRARLGPNHPESLASLRTLAKMRLDSGDARGAIADLADYVERIEARTGGDPTLSATHRGEFSASVQSTLGEAGYRTYARALAMTDPHKALEIAELARGRSLAESVRRRGDAADERLREARRAAAFRLAKAEEAIEAREVGTAGYLAATAERAKAEEQLRSLRPPGENAARAKVPALLARLPKDAAYLAFVADGERVSALVGTAKGEVTGTDLGEIAGLGDSIAALRRLVASSEPAGERVWRVAGGYRWSLSRPEGATGRATDAGEIARALSQRLLAPLAPQLRDKPRWVVSPDGPLAFLPFDLLEIGGHRLEAHHEITLAPSLNAVTAPGADDRRVPEGRRDFLGIGISQHGAAWPSLPQAEAEVRAISELFPRDGRLALVGPQATEAAFARLDATGELARFRYIHIATHAFLSRRGSSLSGVVLAPDAADNTNDGIVTAAEWPAYRLRSDLVVLSACDTGLGTAMPGEGVMGLPYSLLLAGTRGVLLTLWPVADAAAADFMPRFYRRLRQGMAAPRALAETKREQRGSGGPYAHPRHWAAFVLYGVP